MLLESKVLCWIQVRHLPISAEEWLSKGDNLEGTEMYESLDGDN